MALKIDLSDVKEGDKVFGTRFGIDIVDSIFLDRKMINLKEINTTFGFDGEPIDDVPDHPSLFHSIEECIEYFQSVKKDMDEESRPKKRYWLWSICPDRKFCDWVKISNYADDNGLMTSGAEYSKNWSSYKKIKHENEFIDV